MSTHEQISALVQAVAHKPFDLQIGFASPLAVADVAGLSVRRASVGGTMARAAWGGFMHSAQRLSQHRKFDGFASAASGKELNLLLKDNSAAAL